MKTTVAYKLSNAMDWFLETKPMKAIAALGEFMESKNDVEWQANAIMAAMSVPLVVTVVAISTMPQNPDLWNTARVINGFSLSGSIYLSALMSKMWNRVK